MKKTSIALLVLLFFHAGCGMKKMTTHIIGSVSTEGMVALEGEEDIAFARESLPALIKTLEVLHYGDTHDRTTLTLLAKAYGTYAFGFLEEDLLRLPAADPEHAAARARADLFYRRGKSYGQAALSTRAAMRKAMTAPFPVFEKALAGLGRKDVPALFWTAFNWAGWLNLHRDDPAAVVDLPKIRAIVERIIVLSPEYYYGSAYALRGVLAASRPKMLGGDLDLSKQAFASALRIAPDYLFTHVLYAQYYARQAQDASLFQQELQYVLAAKPEAIPEQRLSNALAQRRASLLQKRKADLF